MSGFSAHDEYEFGDGHSAGRRWAAMALRALAIVFWGLVTFALTFAELVAEVVAPLLLMLGGLWWALTQIITALPVPPEIQPMLRSFPTQLVAAGHVLTPTGLIVQGLWLLAVVAACRTLNGIIAKQT
ncbi:hypothetical protein [Roseomonas marmotae]|uniref:Uncharacterized protein n=1 Tax=Roseomonas marmotae TaxID=2768161 RepID=A0ABS3K6S2_9PROT|nr:hypothetical protein [Roseomonas marmotae]MBO1073159.1 hypothetical protein [Roseomonas marmotae]QTI79206.1 hypothetical protein IAI58_16550 [Roseomonas marmotae]